MSHCNSLSRMSDGNHISVEQSRLTFSQLYHETGSKDYANQETSDYPRFPICSFLRTMWLLLWLHCVMWHVTTTPTFKHYFKSGFYPMSAVCSLHFTPTVKEAVWLFLSVPPSSLESGYQESQLLYSFILALSFSAVSFTLSQSNVCHDAKDSLLPCLSSGLEGV